jgi:hypothetical protein
MNSSALVGLTVLGCGLILLALVTPGWIGMDKQSIKEDENIDVSQQNYRLRMCLRLW